MMDFQYKGPPLKVRYVHGYDPVGEILITKVVVENNVFIIDAIGEENLWATSVISCDDGMLEFYCPENF